MNSRNRYKNSLCHYLSALCSAGMLSVSAGASAAEATSSFSVSVVIASGCVVSADNMLLPPLAVGDASMAQSSFVRVLCTNGTAYQVGLGPGSNSTDVAVRRLLGGPLSETIDYSLYQTAAHVLVWGNTQGVNTIGGTGDGSQQALTIYGYGVVPEVLPSAGTYSDVINVYVYY